jgi:predicted anti-sigma-YlaC factor YlaD
MRTEELVDAFIKHIEQHRSYQNQIAKLLNELEKWQAVAMSAIPEEHLVAALGKYALEHKNDVG